MAGGTNTVQSTLPSWLQPYLTQELGAAGGLQTNAVDNPQSMVAPQNDFQIMGLNKIGDVAQSNINPAASAATANQFETSGALLDPNSNPYLKNTFNLAADSAQNQIASEFGTAGSNVINSLPVQSDEMNNLATQLYGGEYDKGISAMTQATALAPSIEQGQFVPGQELYGAGTTQQTQEQNLINAPYNALSWYSGLLGLNGQSLGGQSSANNPNAAVQDVGLGIGGIGAAASLAGTLSSLFEGLGVAAAGA